MKKKRIYLISIIIILVFVILFISRLGGNDSALEYVGGLEDNVYEESYLTYLQEHGYEGKKASQVIPVDITNYQASSDMDVKLDGDRLHTSDEGSITFNFNVKEEGFYQLKLGYIPIEGTSVDIQRKIYLDNESLYDGLSQIVLKRNFIDEEIRVKNKNEIRPEAIEVFNEYSVFIEDYNRRNGEPFLFYLSKGNHTLTFEVIKEPITFTSISFEVEDTLPTYHELLPKLLEQYNEYKGEYVIGQAERVDGMTKSITKSSRTINVQKNYSDSNVVPYHPYRILYNTIGSKSFVMPGDYITWEINVEEEGLYQLTFKGRQNGNRGITSFRKISVNGEVPFEEMKSVAFPYTSDMKNYVLQDNAGSPYLFHLNKGSNYITMEVVLGDFGKVLTEVEKSMYELNQLYLRTIQITGQAPSKYIDYEIVRKISGFADIMQAESERLLRVCDELLVIIGEKGENTSLIEKMAMQAAKLAKDPEGVIEELNQLKNNIAALGTWIVNISNMPLEIDSLVISEANAKLPKATDGFFEGLYYGTIRFFSTFFVKQNELNSDASDAKKDEVLTVWMASSGKEQAQILQNMIDETFIPVSNIKVDLQLIPVDVVLRAALTGTGPDVVVGLTQATIADFAMRNALVDLSKLEGFDEEAKRYYQSAIDGASYLDGVYGLAEQQTFMMLFCREDILSEIGAKIPKTWDEIKEILPLLQKNNYSFFIPKADIYSSMLYQAGGDLYLGTGNDYGIGSALSSDVAMEVFKDLTDFFTSYKLPVNVDFNNRFRTGEIPIGIAEYTMYNQLEIFAPEIKGLWSFSQFPGYENEDGRINNTFVTNTVQSAIMNSSDMIPEGWEFIKWWTSTETQLSYATTIESIMGTSARYAPADKEVLSRLSWNNKELKQLLVQLENTKGIPAIPGSYMTGRMIGYAFDNVVANSANPRETLFLNMKAIDKELLKKRLEFSLSTEEHKDY